MTTTTTNVEVDDWKIVLEDVPTFQVPRFIRLFVINRIISKYLRRKDIDSNKAPLRLLVAQLNDKEIDHEIAHTILSRLIQDGIETYMKKWYNEKEQATVIELIFKNIILVQFGKEYQQLTSYYNDSDNDEQQYHCQVFNNDDLMCQIFGYLTFQKGFLGQLYDCSLVNSCWLYHIWNTKLIYGKYNLDHFMIKTRDLNQENINNNNNNNTNVLRCWERLINLKHITLWAANDVRPKEHNLFFSRLSMLRNIKKIECHCDPTQIATIKVRMQQCSKNIIVFDVQIDGYSRNPGPVLSPLKLPNANNITMHDQYFYTTWTNKCDKFKINHKINERWLSTCY